MLGIVPEMRGSRQALRSKLQVTLSDACQELSMLGNLHNLRAR